MPNTSTQSAEKQYVEYQDQVYPVVRYKFAFQWLESEGLPWWLKYGQEAPEHIRVPYGSEDSLETSKQAFSATTFIDDIDPSALPPVRACDAKFLNDRR